MEDIKSKFENLTINEKVHINNIINEMFSMQQHNIINLFKVNYNVLNVYYPRIQDITHFYNGDALVINSINKLYKNNKEIIKILFSHINNTKVITDLPITDLPITTLSFNKKCDFIKILNIIALFNLAKNKLCNVSVNRLQEYNLKEKIANVNDIIADLDIFKINGLYNAIDANSYTHNANYFNLPEFLTYNMNLLFCTCIDIEINKLYNLFEKL
jgi:hypothetical protein